MALSDEPVRFSSFSDDDDAPAADTLDDDVAALAAQLEAFEANDQRQEARNSDFDISFEEDKAPAATSVPDEPAASPPPAAPPVGGFGGFGNLELAPMDDTPADTPVAVSFASGNGKAEQLSSRLSLAEHDAAPSQAMHAGALLVLAGLGGPDAVRQLLAALPVNLPLPVLLYQHLDTGKHDRLVDQLAKASRMPVDLAQEGKLAYPGRVAVLPPGMGARLDGDSLSFASGDLAAVLAALPPADSGVLVLSGADSTLVAAVLEIHAAGGLGFAMYALAPNGYWFWAAMPVAALWAVAGPAAQSLMTARVSPSEQGRLQGAIGSLNSIAGILGPTLFTQTLAFVAANELRGPMAGASFWLAAVMVSLGGLLAWRVTTTRP